MQRTYAVYCPRTAASAQPPLLTPRQTPPTPTPLIPLSPPLSWCQSVSHVWFALAQLCACQDLGHFRQDSAFANLPVWPCPFYGLLLKPRWHTHARSTLSFSLSISLSLSPSLGAKIVQLSAVSDGRQSRVLGWARFAPCNIFIIKRQLDPIFIHRTFLGELLLLSHSHTCYLCPSPFWAILLTCCVVEWKAIQVSR